VFEQGGINGLVGTKSLLGEGWDAPAVNTLVLGTFVGSYVLSNQMRGRSIRIRSEKSDKDGKCMASRVRRAWSSGTIILRSPGGSAPLWMLMLRQKRSKTGLKGLGSAVLRSHRNGSLNSMVLKTCALRFTPRSIIKFFGPSQTGTPRTVA
jgi:hypothetical protein